MNCDLKIEKFLPADLDSIPGLQPEGWPDILPSIQFYCSSDFCFPLKATIGGRLAGTGTAIIYGYSAWLAHIIVHKDYRNSGIGTSITKSLVELTRHSPCETMLLLATNLGEPVYKKLGFVAETEYVFFDEGTLPALDPDSRITPLLQGDHEALLRLDHIVSGEDRRKLITGHFAHGYVFRDNGSIKGFYLPTLGEGLIIADNPETGLALMQLRAVNTKKFCLPAENADGINILARHGFKEYRRAPRMLLGKKLTWDGSKMYGRIGGNLG